MFINANKISRTWTFPANTLNFHQRSGSRDEYIIICENASAVHGIGCTNNIRYHVTAILVLRCIKTRLGVQSCYAAVFSRFSMIELSTKGIFFNVLDQAKRDAWVAVAMLSCTPSLVLTHLKSKMAATWYRNIYSRLFLSLCFFLQTAKIFKEKERKRKYAEWWKRKKK